MGMAKQSNDKKPTYRHRTPTFQGPTRARGGAGGADTGIEGRRPSISLGAENSQQGETQAGSAARWAGDGARALNPTTRTRTRTRSRSRSRSRSRERRGAARSRVRSGNRSNSKERRQAEEVKTITRGFGWVTVADDESDRRAGWGSSPDDFVYDPTWGRAAAQAAGGAWGSAPGASWGTESKSAEPERSAGWGTQTDRRAGWGSPPDDEPTATADDGWGAPRREVAAWGSESKSAEPGGREAR